jgi:hypothetical protein
MVVFLIAVIAVLLGLIVYLNLEFYKEKKRFRAKIADMQQVIAEITRKQLGQNGQIKLSDELTQKLRSSQATLEQDIFGLNYALFELLSKNNGPKK